MNSWSYPGPQFLVIPWSISSKSKTKLQSIVSDLVTLVQLDLDLSTSDRFSILEHCITVPKHQSLVSDLITDV